MMSALIPRRPEDQRVLQALRSGNITERQKDVVALFFLASLPPLFFWRQTLGWLTLASKDAAFWYLPLWKLAVEQVKAGQLPLWNPYLYSGTALFAQWQPGILDPLNWLHLLGPNSQTMTAAQEITLAVGLLGTFAFARQIGMKRRAAITSAVVFALNGFIVARTIYPALLHVVALLPCLLWLVERISQRGRWRDVVLGSIVVTWQIFAAHPQPFAYSSLLIGGYAIFSSLPRGAEPGDVRAGVTPQFWHYVSRVRWGFLIKCAVMFTLGVCMAAVQLMPAWEVAGQSLRRQVPYEFFTLNSLHPISLLTALFPFLHGEGTSLYHLSYWGTYWSHNEGQFYLGLLALSLATASAIGLWRQRTQMVAFWSIVAVVAVVFALGKYVPPIAWLVYQVPLLGNFRSPNRHWMEVTFAIAILSGLAVDRLLSGAARTLERSALVAGGLLTLLCAIVSGYALWRAGSFEALIRQLPDMNLLSPGFLLRAKAEFYMPMITAAALMIVLLAFVRTRHRSRFYPLLLGALLADFQLYATFAPISSQGQLETMIGLAMPRELTTRQSELEPIRYHLLLKPNEGGFSPFWFYGHEMATGYDPLVSQRYQTFSGINEAGRSERWSILSTRDRTLDLLNVRFVLVPSGVLTALPTDKSRKEVNGIVFSDDPSSEVELQAGAEATFLAEAGNGDQLAIISTLANALDVVHGTGVSEVVVGCASGGRWVTELRAGYDTAEWTYDRSDVRPGMKHKRAPLAEHWPGDAQASFDAHSYLARFSLPTDVAKCETTRYVRITSKRTDGVTIGLKRLALYDSRTNLSTPLRRDVNGNLTDPERWREISTQPGAGYTGLRVFENLRTLPRAWLVSEVVPMSETSQLQAIQGSETAQPFDPSRVALVEPGLLSRLDQNLRRPSDSLATTEKMKATIVMRTSQELKLTTEASGPTMLVISELDYPGWGATVDGRPVDSLRVNYLLRGIPLSSGAHRVALSYWPSSLTIGMIISLTAVLFSIGILVRSRQSSSNKQGLPR